jgi:hypothetical protein
MAVINKGISKAVTEEFINGTHDAEAMIVKLSHLNTDSNRTAYIIHLTKVMREKYGFDVKRRSKKKKTGSKPTQLALDFRKKFHPNKDLSPAQAEPTPLSSEVTKVMLVRQEEKVRTHTGFYGDGDVTAREHSVGFEPQRIVESDDVTAEYVKLDDEHKVLMAKYESLVFKYTDEKDKVEELNREVARLKVIVSYLEGKK